MMNLTRPIKTSFSSAQSKCYQKIKNDKKLINKIIKNNSAKTRNPAEDYLKIMIKFKALCGEINDPRTPKRQKQKLIESARKIRKAINSKPLDLSFFLDITLKHAGMKNSITP